MPHVFVRTSHACDMRDMGKLIFEQIDDVRVAYPYLFVYFLADHQTFKLGRGHPFMQIEVTRDGR
jgi:hypothetical protein